MYDTAVLAVLAMACVDLPVLDKRCSSANITKISEQIVD